MTVIIQRPLKGSRISSFYPVKSLPPLSALDSAFQLQEYISLLIRLDVHDVACIVSIPGKGASEGQDNGDFKGDDKDGEKEGTGSVNVDEACWVYEQLRRLAQDLSHPLITMLQQECTRSTCPEMKAGEWLYLCVAHGNEGAMEQCCAIDYILHTLDSATALLNSPRAFPSRLSVPPTSNRHFSSLARRLGRIFAHAYFHHREAFEQAEAESSLYARFLALTSKYDLVPAEFLVIPPRLTAMSDDDRGGRGEHVEPPRLLAASLDPRRDFGRDDGGWPTQSGGDRGTSPPGAPSQRGHESPRKFGRNRTDTMVYSEAFSVAEELAKSDLSEVDIDREIAAERAAAAAEADLPTIEPPHPIGDALLGPSESPTINVIVPPDEEPEEAEKDAEEEEEEEDSPTEEVPPEADIAQEPILVILSSRPDETETAAEAEAEDTEAEAADAKTEAAEAEAEKEVAAAEAVTPASETEGTEAEAEAEEIAPAASDEITDAAPELPAPSEAPAAVEESAATEAPPVDAPTDVKDEHGDNAAQETEATDSTKESLEEPSEEPLSEASLAAPAAAEPETEPGPEAPKAEEATAEITVELKEGEETKEVKESPTESEAVTS